MWPIESHGLSPMSIHRKWKKSWKFNILHHTSLCWKKPHSETQSMGTRPFTGSIKTTYFIYFPKKWEIIWYADDIFFQMRIRYESSFLTRTNFTKKLRVFPLKKVGNHASLAQTIFRWRKRWLCRRWFSDMAGLHLLTQEIGFF